ncbi:hypothetical protein MUK42_15732 [Musa troglodytarum]|uniref:Uncharacterized protein n=1 Tax=Musa troglodytarum TaxID=320322 RepID=A0A9E7I2H4_9LILI|nr:hypothetical protein MUK42_15732 [Musa troglodytarum]
MNTVGAKTSTRCALGAASDSIKTVHLKTNGDNCQILVRRPRERPRSGHSVNNGSRGLDNITSSPCTSQATSEVQSPSVYGDGEIAAWGISASDSLIVDEGGDCALEDFRLICIQFAMEVAGIDISTSSAPYEYRCAAPIVSAKLVTKANTPSFMSTKVVT